MSYRQVHYFCIHLLAIFICLSAHGAARIEKTYVSAFKISGFLQTPLGGGIGSSTLKEPNLKYLNTRTTFWKQLRLTVPISPFIFYFYNNPIHVQGYTILKKPLITYGISIPSGTKMHVDSKIRWQSIGPKISISLLPRIHLQIEVQVAWIHFYYHFQTSKVSGVRTYQHLVPRIIVGIIQTHANNREVNCNIGLPFIFSTNLNIKTTGCAVSMKNFPTLGAEQILIHYRDHQDLPNDIRFKTIALLSTF